MRKWSSWGIAVCLLVSLVAQGTGQTPKQKTGGVELINMIEAENQEGKAVDLPVSFTLFKDGEIVRSSELSTRQTAEFKAFGNPYRTSWKDLPIGIYELHCEAVGQGKLVRRVAVSADTPASVGIRTLPAKEEVQGVGPTLFEMQRKITLLEKQNAALQERLAALEKAR